MGARAMQAAFGLTFAVGAVRPFVRDGADVTLVAAALALVHAIVAILFFVRRPGRSGTRAQIALAVPAFLLGGVALTVSPPPTTWSWAARLVVLSGVCVTCLGLVSLGRSFAIFPALRGVVRDGAYAWVRHPVYAGELLVVVGFGIASGVGIGAPVIATFALLLALRIHAEESLLRTDPSYVRYAERVTWRVVPGVW